MARKLRVFINGFGRIGRTILRQIAPGAGDGFELAGINDIAPLETCAYLLKYDSVYGPYPAPVETGPGCIRVNGRQVRFTSAPDLRALDLSGIDVVLECTGQAKDRPFAEAGLAAGAAHVLISGPSPAADKTIVLGANDSALGQARIVSNASCTTNAIAPLLAALGQDLELRQAHVTTIHCYTASQPLADQPGPSPERSRAGAVSMIPTSTSAAGQILEVLPQLQGRLSVAAVRVPCLSVSAIDAVIQAAAAPAEGWEAFLRGLFEGSPLIGLSSDPCVSSDFRGRPESLILALPEIRAAGTGQLRLLGWYDNEWGFSARMLEMARRMGLRAPAAG